MHTWAQKGSLQLDSTKRGRLLEMAVGSDLNTLTGDLYYWRENTLEVDYIYQDASYLYAIEVKLGKTKSLSGLTAFTSKYKLAIPIILTEENYSQFAQNPQEFLEKHSR